MKKSWGLTEKILAGEKVIESRWYKHRSAPWGIVAAGDTIYFKDSGRPVTAAAEIEDVLAFAGLTPIKVRQLLDEYGERDGIGPAERNHYYELFKDKRYCLLMFLNNVRRVEPFEVDKRGYGSMAAWLVAEDITRIKKDA